VSFEQVSGSVTANLSGLVERVMNVLPSFAGALFLVVVGYFISKYVGRSMALILNKLGLDRLSEKVGFSQLLASWKLSPNLSGFIGKIIFVFIFLIFLISAADVLQMKSLSEMINSFIAYLPNIIGAFLVFFMVSIAGHFAREALSAAGESMRLPFAKTLGQFVYGALLLIGIILAVGQLKIETEFLTQVLEILIIAASIALALSIGFGTRDVSKNIVAGVYLKETITEGNKVRIGDYEGILIEVKPVSFILQEDSGRLVVLPNSRLLDCEILETPVKTSV